MVEGFEELDRYEIVGRGPVYIVQIPASSDYYGRPRALIGEHVIIDQGQYIVRDVETFGVPEGHDALKGPCGLHVEVVDA